jgi:hypothetical protein
MLGCLVHPKIIVQRVKDGTWLHSLIPNVLERCLGIDINSGVFSYPVVPWLLQWPCYRSYTYRLDNGRVADQIKGRQRTHYF